MAYRRCLIALSDAGNAIVRSTIGQCCGMKRVDCCPVISGEGEMDREPLPALLLNPQARIAASAEAVSRAAMGRAGRIDADNER